MQKENKVKPEKGRSRLIKDRTGLKKKTYQRLKKRSDQAQKQKRIELEKQIIDIKTKKKKFQIKVNFDLIKLNYS